MTDRTHHHSAHDRGAHDQGAHDHPGHVETGVYSHEGTPVPPSYAGSVVPEVGGMVGALVLYASALLAGAEVEVVRQGEPGHTYQLWALTSGKVVSLGVLGPDPRNVPFRVEPAMTLLMVTAEPAGGTPVPTNPVVAQGAVSL
jgi:hypothetical protein